MPLPQSRRRKDNNIMKLTKSRLHKFIKEELNNVLAEFDKTPSSYSFRGHKTYTASGDALEAAIADIRNILSKLEDERRDSDKEDKDLEATLGDLDVDKKDDKLSWNPLKWKE